MKQIRELGFGEDVRVLMPDNVMLEAWDAYHAIEAGEYGDVDEPA